MIMIYYEGPLNTNMEGKELCEYYTMAMAINHLSYIKKDFQCLEESARINNIKKLPKTITDKDLSNNIYNISQYYEVRYPEDFDTYKLEETGVDGEVVIFQSIDI